MLSYYVVLPSEILTDPNLTSTEKILLAFVSGLMTEERGCYATNEYLASRLQVGVRHVQKILEKAEAMGYIRREVDRDPETQEVTERRLYVQPKGVETPPENGMTPPALYGMTPPALYGVYNNNKNNKEYIEPPAILEGYFEQFWTLYPRKVAKPAAKKSYLRIFKDFKKADCAAAADLSAQILRGLRGHISHWEKHGTEPAFIPHPATWLNQERWNDLIEVTAEAPVIREIKIGGGYAG